MGNPPYIGSSMQNAEQKEDMAIVFKGFKSYKDLDYISTWFIRGSNYIKNFNSELAFVSTNSICQGEQVALLWPSIFNNNIEIGFAHTSFAWNNNAKANAAVFVIIVGLRNLNSQNKKYLFGNNIKNEVKNINPYLSSGSSASIFKRIKPISNISPMSYGSKIVDNGYLIFSTEEKDALLKEYPKAEKLIKKLVGSAEFIHSLDRWCLYISEKDLDLALSIPIISNRLELVKKFREKSTESSTREMAKMPHKFYYSAHNNSNSIIIPRTSSERRAYIPMGFLEGNTIVSDAASVIFNSEPWSFSILNSKFHMEWVKAVGGRLKSDYRYSSQLCYNTFPFPPISNQRKEELTQCTFRILEEREKHPEKTLAQLYDPDKMPEGLKEAHRLNDEAVERCYRSTPFTSDEERLEYLFKLYEKMIQEEKEKGTLFETEKKTRKKK